MAWIGWVITALFWVPVALLWTLTIAVWGSAAVLWWWLPPWALICTALITLAAVIMTFTQARYR